jgi:hypothetical protein
MGGIDMKMNKSAWFSILLTVVLIGLLAVFLVNGTLSKGSATAPAQPYEISLFYVFLAALGVWCLSGALGWIVLFRRGFFADQLEKMVGYAWLGCIVGIFLLAGLWMVAVLPGPYLLWFATTRRQRPMCPQCKNWMPHGATRCAHCGALMPGAQAEKLVTPQPAESQPQAPTEATCEKCKAVNPVGASYVFYYGTFAGSEYLGDQRTRYDFKIAGTQEIFLCNQCVTEYGRKRAQRKSLGISAGLAALVIGLSVCSLLMSVANPDATSQINMMPAVVLLLILAPLLYFWMQRQARKQPLAQGDLLAMELRKPALKSQGYTRFFTRQQVRDGNLL